MKKEPIMGLNCESSLLGAKIKKTQRGVAAIEYALMASLIGLAIVVGLKATGLANFDVWKSWTAKFITALGGA